jgi:GTP-binding protein EngB required for normal cell division
MRSIRQREVGTQWIEGTVREIAERLRALAAIAADAGAEGLVHDATERAERLAQGRFFVACVGQFKRGKSTLLNALLDRSLLPTGVVPITTAVTVLRYGPALTARVRFSDGRRAEVDPELLADYVSEARNPENHKGVTVVEVTVPTDLLVSGMCLVDTPGLGSVFAANTAATRAFVPHIDAALVVLGTDPPISWEELALIREVGKEVDHLVVVLNKSDRVTDADSREAAAFTRRALARHLDRDVGDIYRVSATERLAGRATRDWPLLEEALRDLAGQSADVLDAAAARGLARIARALLRDLDEQSDALSRPIEDSERRLAELRHAIVEAEHALRELSARLRVEQVGLSSRFGDLREAFLAHEVPSAGGELAEAVRASPAPRGPAFRDAAMGLGREVARHRVTAWAGEVEPKAEALYSETMTRFVELANSFVARLSSGASEGIALRQEEFSVERGFRQDAHFFFTSLLTLTAPGFWSWLLDWIRPRGWLVASAIRQASQYMNRLIATNSARVANDLTARVEESQRRLESEIRLRLSALVTTAERALGRAREQQAAGAEAVRAELARIDRLREQVKDQIGKAAH